MAAEQTGFIPPKPGTGRADAELEWRKRMKKKKVFAIALVAAMTAGTLSGCGNTDAGGQGGGSSSSQSSQQPSSSSTGGSSSSSESQGSQEPASGGERMTISVLGIDWGYGPSPNSEMEQYWEDLFDVNLEIEWVNYNDYPQKLNTLIASNSQPDVTQIMSTNNTYYYPIFTQAIEAGNFVDLKPYIFDGDNALAKTNAVMKNWSDAFWNEATYNGGIYILPRSKSEPAKESGIMVRKDLMEKYGYTEEPKTMDELKDWLIGLSKAATEGEGQKIYGIEFFKEDFMNDKIKAFAIAFTGQTNWGIDDNGEFQYLQFHPKYIDFLNWMKDLYDAGAIDPEFALGNDTTSKFKAGNSVALLNAWYNFNQSADLTSNKIFDKSTPDTYKTWELMPVQGPEAYTVSPNSTDVDSCIAISSSCSEEKIQKILQVFNGTEEAYPGYNTVMSDGVEGIHYVLLEDGTKDTSPEGMGQKRTEGYVGAWNQIFLKTDADQIKDKFMRSGAKRSDDEHIQRAQEVKAFIVDYLAETGLKHENSNLQSDTYNNQWTMLTDDVNTMCTQYVMGQIDEAAWKSFVEEIVNSDTYKAIQKEFKESAGR